MAIDAEIAAAQHVISRVRMIPASDKDYLSWKAWVKGKHAEEQKQKRVRRAEEIRKLEQEIGETFPDFVAAVQHAFTRKEYTLPVANCGACSFSKPDRYTDGRVCWHNWISGRPPRVQAGQIACQRPPKPSQDYGQYLNEQEQGYFAQYLKWRIQLASGTRTGLTVQHVAAWLSDLELAKRDEVAPPMGFQHGVDFEKWGREWLLEVAAEADLAVYPLRIFSFLLHENGRLRQQFREVDALVPDHRHTPPWIHAVEFKADGCFSGADRFYEWYQPLVQAAFPKTVAVPTEVVKQVSNPYFPCPRNCDGCAHHWSPFPGKVIPSLWGADPARYNVLWLEVLDYDPD